MEKTLTTVKEHSIWREKKPPLEMTEPIKKFIEKGYLYIHGRDNKFRPIIVFNAYTIDSKNFDVDLMIDALTFFFEFLITYILLPGQIENWIFITDLKGMSLTSIPFNAIKKLISYLQHNYRGRLSVMYIVNAPSSIYIPWQMAKKFMEESTAKKMQFIKKQVPEGLKEHAHTEQIEVKYGGSADNVTQFWPPKFPSNKYYVKNEDYKSVITKEEYSVRYKKGQLQKMNVNMKLIQNTSEPININSANTTQLSATSKAENDVTKGLPLYLPSHNHHELSNKEKLHSVGIQSARTLVHNKTENHHPLKAAKTFTVSEIEEGDYMDQMDEDYDVVVKSRLIHHFKTNFLTKFDTHY